MQRERAAATDPVEPFIGPDGYRQLIRGEEDRFREVQADQRRRL